MFDNDDALTARTGLSPVENIKECELDSEEESRAGHCTNSDPAEYSPSSSPLRLAAPKGCNSDGSPNVSDTNLKPKALPQSGVLSTRFVPVVDSSNKPLMPTKRSRALSWIKSKKATPFYVRGIFCVRLNQEPSARNYQDIACAIDPGSKKEGYTLKSKAHTYFNIQADAVTWVKDAIKTRSDLRRCRRYRKTPYRKCRINRSRTPGWLAPSTKARWAWKLRVVTTLKRIFPVNLFVVEDIAAETKKGQKKWNTSFSPLEIGKHWFYQKLRLLGKLETRKGYETKTLRDKLGLKKSKKKLEESFNAHCVDSWVLAWDLVGGDPTPNNTDVLYIAPIRLHRRQLHYMQPSTGGVRRPYGSTRSIGFKRGSLLRHNKYGVCYAGGTSNNRISLHCVETGRRLCQNAKPSECKVLAWNTWRIWTNESRDR